MKYSKYSAVIIGSGISGLYLAYKLAKSKNNKDGVLIITKSSVDECNSRLAQGGIVAVMPDINKADSISSHVFDTVKAGAGLNDFNTVKYVSEYSALAIKGLINAGVKFDKKEDGSFDFALEGAHSLPRILHTKDKTGLSIENALIEQVNKAKEIEIYENTMAIELLDDATGAVRGVLTFNEKNGEYEAIFSNVITIATGGAGQVYKYTTSRPVTTGDGIYLANSIGAEISDMEFVQFHPTALNISGLNTLPLVSEAVRGEGAKLVNKKGERFILNYDKMGELAPRDVVARAIYDEMKKTGENFVYLDISDIGIEKFKTRFPSITKYCDDNGIELNKNLIPVAPAVHYFMGGIKVNLDFETNIKNLYAIGEAAATGLHGANRLASNSLLECVVSAMGLYDNLSYKDLRPPKNYDEKIKNFLYNFQEQEPYFIEDSSSLKAEIKNLMWNYAGILRDENRLNKGLFELNEIKKKIEGRYVFSDFASYEIRNMIAVSEIIIKSALKRRNSAGAHYRT
ncbi:MAG: L-aspartate oxidase, partial [Candidatus Gastranaerophilales bacterium]|nr:L-aspartate oxidase [Candidatus Gastranaerophilales bacterium]